MAGIKTTNETLVKELEERNEGGKYDEIITNAKNNVYHDFKSNETMPKVKLVQDLGRFPELGHIKQDVMGGMYDEPADSEDKARMRADLEADGAPPEMFKILGLDEEESE